MTGVGAVQRRSALFIAVVMAAITVAVPLGARAAQHAHIDPSLDGLRGRVRVVVQATDAVSAADAVHFAGGTITRDLPIAHGFAATVPSDAINSLAAKTSISTISLDARVHVLGAPDGGKVKSVYPKAVNADRMWQSGYSGTGITVAVIDTGIADVPDLAGRIVPVTDDVTQTTSSCQNFSGEEGCGDSYGHGTFIGGLIAGSGISSGGDYPGMAPDARLLSVKIAGASGASDVSTVLAAIQWVVSFKDRYGIKVLNLSLGTDGTQTYRTDPFDYAVERAWSAGIVVVVSAGNDGPNPGTIAKPADDPFVVTVGAVDDMTTAGVGDDALPNFSGQGPTAADGIQKPDVAAPGAHIVGLRAPGSAIDTNFPHLDDYYHKGSGTSMAAGVVSGAVALLLQARPTASPDRIKYMLKSTARSVCGCASNQVGSGEIDVAGALSAPSGIANQGLAKSSGMGSLDASRGSVDVMTTDDPVGTLLGGLTTAQLLLFSQLTYVLGSWSPTTWYGSQWYGNQWHEVDWVGNQWHGSQWYGNQWHGEPEGNQWYGNQWHGSQWYGSWE